MSVVARLPAIRRNAEALRQQGRPERARDLLEPALDVSLDSFGPDHPDTLETMRLLAMAERDLANLTGARRLLEEALAGGQYSLGDGDPLMLTMAAQLAGIAAELGNRYEARRNFERVAELGPAVLGGDHPAVTAARRYLGGGTDHRTSAPVGVAPVPDRSPAAPPVVPPGAPPAQRRATVSPERAPAGTWTQAPFDPLDRSPVRPEQPPARPAPSRPEPSHPTPRRPEPAPAPDPAGTPPASPEVDGAGSDQDEPSSDRHAEPEPVVGPVRLSTGTGSREPTPPPQMGRTRRSAEAGPTLDAEPTGHVPAGTPESARAEPATRSADRAEPAPEGERDQMRPGGQPDGSAETGKDPFGNLPRRQPSTSDAGLPAEDIEPGADPAGGYGHPPPSGDPRPATAPDGGYRPAPSGGYRPAMAPPSGYEPAATRRDSGYEPAAGGSGAGYSSTVDLQAEHPGHDLVHRPGATVVTTREPGRPGTDPWADRLPVPVSYAAPGRTRAVVVALVAVGVLAVASAGAAAATWLATRRGPAPVAVSPAPTPLATPTPAPTPSPSAALAAPTGVALSDQGSTITITWRDPTAGAVPFLVGGGQPGQPMHAFQAVNPGVTTYTVRDLNPALDYCFTVVAVYDTNRLGTSDPVCTTRHPIGGATA